MIETNSYAPHILTALTHCERAVGHRDRWQSACTRLSKVFQRMGETDDAQLWMRWGEAGKLNLAQVYAQLGRHYTDLNNWERAIAAYRNLLTLESDSAGTYQRLVHLYERAGLERERLESWYQYLLLRPAEATAEQHYHLAQEFRDRNEDLKAIDCYQRTLARNPHFWQAYFDLADVYLSRGNLERAIATYQTLLERDPDRIEAHYKLGKVWLQNQNYERAVVKFKETIELAPHFPGAYQDIVKTFMRQGLWDEAIVTCSAIIELVKPFPWTYTFMGNALHKKGETLKAIACHQKSCELRGWDLCAMRGYHFTQDHFSQQIALWRRHLEPIAKQTGVNVLLIGCSEGMVSCWLLDCLLKHPSDRLTCADNKFSDLFSSNLEQNGGTRRVLLKAGSPEDTLKSLAAGSYDLVIIQDRYKQANTIGQIVQLAWPLLKLNGIMLFRGYLWRHSAQSQDSPKAIIDRFLSSIESEFEVIHQSYQLFIQKVASAAKISAQSPKTSDFNYNQSARSVKTLMLVAIERTGSNYLCNLLSRHPQIEARSEIFANVEAMSLTDGEIEALSKMANRSFVNSIDPDLVKYLKTNSKQIVDLIENVLTEDKPIFSFKIFRNHLAFEEMFELIESCEVIFVTRTVIDSYISFIKALKLKTWIGKDMTDFRPEININHFVKWYNQNHRYYQFCARKYRETYRREIHTLRYDQFTQGTDLENLHLVTEKISAVTGIQLALPKSHFKSFFCKQDRNDSVDKKVSNWSEFKKQLQDKGFFEKAFQTFI